MSRSAAILSEKITRLSDTQLVEVERFIESPKVRDHQLADNTSMAASERSFAAVWDNPEDDVYNAHL